MVVLKIYKKRKVVLFIIKGTSIQKFVLIDLMLGTGLYYVVKIIYSSVIVATIGSLIGTEGVKRLRR
ncbi:hypothetical protein FPL14_29300 [Cohnella cholangitidis]|uniref:Uncharacterized protein n=1 Tax=Cohnella cholangitidis TaxID=2598458 RepID=A0A7G5C6G6_9BACL|nr:hypothetical protein FPL14_29300 [Cohnella cholangitidis]